MLLANLVLIGLLGQVSVGQADPLALTSQLGSRRYSEREAASEALERLGRTALPALRAARDSRDLEVRNRAQGLIQKIEGALLTTSSTVRLDFSDAPLAEVVRSLSQQTGFKVVLYPENTSKWKTQRVTLRQAESVPFWKAIDQLCEVAQLQYNLTMHAPVGPREPMFSLNDGAMRTVTPNSDHGPFRVSLLSMYYERRVDYSPLGIGPGFRPQLGNPGGGRRLQPVAPPQTTPVTTEQFSAHLLVGAEPRLCVSQVGAVRVVEAVDEHNHSLAVSNANAQPINRFTNYLGTMDGSVVQFQIPLHRPAIAGKTIKKLRGEIPLSVSSRRPDPLVVPLDQATGKRFENHDVELTVHEIRPVPNTRQILIELSVKPKERGTLVEPGESDTFFDAYRPDFQRVQLELTDSRGQVVPALPSGVDSETAHLTLTVNSLSASAPLKELRYYALTHATVNVPFEFKDVEMP